MSVVHASQGHIHPPSGDLLSEIAIVCRLARALFCDADGRPRPGTPQADWAALEGDYRLIRRHIEAVVPGFVDYEQRIDHPGGFRLPHGPHDVRVFETSSTKAHFVSSELWWPTVPPGRLLLQTLRSHDQFNTTIYGPDDRYRGITGGRRVVMVNPADLAELGFADGDVVDLVSEFGRRRRPARRGVPRRRLRHRPRLRRRLLPGDERPGPAGLHGRPVQHARRASRSSSGSSGAGLTPACAQP